MEIPIKPGLVSGGRLTQKEYQQRKQFATAQELHKLFQSPDYLKRRIQGQNYLKNPLILIISLALVISLAYLGLNQTGEFPRQQKIRTTDQILTEQSQSYQIRELQSQYSQVQYRNNLLSDQYSNLQQEFVNQKEKIESQEVQLQEEQQNLLQLKSRLAEQQIQEEYLQNTIKSLQTQVTEKSLSFKQYQHSIKRTNKICLVGDTKPTILQQLLQDAEIYIQENPLNVILAIIGFVFILWAFNFFIKKHKGQNQNDRLKIILDSAGYEEADLRSPGTQIEELNKELDKLYAKEEEYRSVLYQSNQFLSESQVQKSQLKQDITDLVVEKAKLEKEKNDAVSSSQTLDLSMIEIKSKLDVIENKLVDKENEVTDLESKTQYLEKIVTQKTNELKAVESEKQEVVAEYQTQIKILEERLYRNQSQHEQEMQNAEQENQTLKSKLDGVDTQIEVLEKQIQEQKDSITSLQSQNKQISHEKQQLQERVVDQNIKLTQQQTKYTENVSFLIMQGSRYRSLLSEVDLERKVNNNDKSGMKRYINYLKEHFKNLLDLEETLKEQGQKLNYPERILNSISQDNSSYSQFIRSAILNDNAVDSKSNMNLFELPEQSESVNKSKHKPEKSSGASSDRADNLNVAKDSDNNKKFDNQLYDEFMQSNQESNHNKSYSSSQASEGVIKTNRSIDPSHNQQYYNIAFALDTNMTSSDFDLDEFDENNVDSLKDKYRKDIAQHIAQSVDLQRALEKEQKQSFDLLKQRQEELDRAIEQLNVKQEQGATENETQTDEVQSNFVQSDIKGAIKEEEEDTLSSSNAQNSTLRKQQTWNGSPNEYEESNSNIHDNQQAHSDCVKDYESSVSQIANQIRNLKEGTGLMEVIHKRIDLQNTEVREHEAQIMKQLEQYKKAYFFEIAQQVDEKNVQINNFKDQIEVYKLAQKDHERVKFSIQLLQNNYSTYKRETERLEEKLMKSELLQQSQELIQQELYKQKQEQQDYRWDAEMQLKELNQSLDYAKLYLDQQGEQEQSGRMSPVESDPDQDHEQDISFNTRIYGKQKKNFDLEADYANIKKETSNTYIAKKIHDKLFMNNIELHENYVTRLSFYETKVENLDPHKFQNKDENFDRKSFQENKIKTSSDVYKGFRKLEQYYPAYNKLLKYIELEVLIQVVKKKQFKLEKYKQQLTKILEDNTAEISSLMEGRNSQQFNQQIQDQIDSLQQVGQVQGMKMTEVDEYEEQLEEQLNEYEDQYESLSEGYPVDYLYDQRTEHEHKINDILAQIYNYLQLFYPVEDLVCYIPNDQIQLRVDKEENIELPRNSTQQKFTSPPFNQFDKAHIFRPSFNQGGSKNRYQVNTSMTTNSSLDLTHSQKLKLNEENFSQMYNSQNIYTPTSLNLSISRELYSPLHSNTNRPHRSFRDPEQTQDLAQQQSGSNLSKASTEKENDSRQNQGSKGQGRGQQNRKRNNGKGRKVLSDNQIEGTETGEWMQKNNVSYDYYQDLLKKLDEESISSGDMSGRQGQILQDFVPNNEYKDPETASSHNSNSISFQNDDVNDILDQISSTS